MNNKKISNLTMPTVTSFEQRLSKFSQRLANKTYATSERLLDCTGFDYFKYLGRETLDFVFGSQNNMPEMALTTLSAAIEAVQFTASLLHQCQFLMKFVEQQ